jgi:hypothetical protein
MKLKKMLLLATAALALVAFAAPAAQAEQHEFNEATESYEGVLTITVASPASGQLHCEVTMSLSAEGGTTAEIEQFTPTTSTCVGTGLFTGCVVKEHTTSVPFLVHTTLNNDLTIDDPPGNVVLHYMYEKCIAGITSTSLEFSSLTANPNPTTGAIHELTINGTSTTGVTISGVVTAEGEELIELN